jgi:hypothetical protein
MESMYVVLPINTSAYHKILGEKEKIGDFRIFQTAPIRF